jgi:membrane associated rhomboid family serine protease
MIPLRTTIQSRNYPIVTTIIISLNVLFFILTPARDPELRKFMLTYGLVPARYSTPEITAYFGFGQQAFAFLSFMFLHGGFWHLLGNMWFLHIFGDNVEDRLGSIRYIIFYLLCGWASGITHLVMNWHSQIPTIGASGAIAGVMGAYLLLYPRSRILTFIPIFFIPYFTEILAFFFLGFWIFLQFLNAAGTHAQTGGIAWWAHIGGFLFGMAFLKMFLRIPEVGVTSQVRRAMPKRKTPHLQVIRPTGSGDDPHLYGQIKVTPREAISGGRKLVNIPWGFHKRLFRINVPSGVSHGTVLRLAGMGREMSEGERGDLYLKVLIDPQ